MLNQEITHPKMKKQFKKNLFTITLSFIANILQRFYTLHMHCK